MNEGPDFVTAVCTVSILRRTQSVRELVREGPGLGEKTGSRSRLREERRERAFEGKRDI